MHQYKQGLTTTQGHKGIPDQHFEEEQGRSGFFGPVSHLLKPEPSTRWVHIHGDLKPRLYDLVRFNKVSPEVIYESLRMFYNQDLEISFMHILAWDQASVEFKKAAFRQADADTLYFCHQGEGAFLTEYGLLSFTRGSYINIPKCVVHSIVAKTPCEFLVIQSKNSFYREPDRGMVGRNGFYDLAALGKPDLDQLHDFKKQHEINILQIHVQKLNRRTRFDYAADIYDTVGWKGDFFPFTLHIRDLMPLISPRVHLPPSAHTTFVAQGFVVCTFLPRPLESDTDALKVPFYHQNIDYDEILFYHDGDFFSRDNLHAGMLSFHPSGFPHGPHPKAIEKIKTKTHTDEVAVMIDSKLPLMQDSGLTAIEVPDYWKSWMK